MAATPLFSGDTSFGDSFDDGSIMSNGNDDDEQTASKVGGWWKGVLVLSLWCCHVAWFCACARQLKDEEEGGVIGEWWDVDGWMGRKRRNYGWSYVRGRRGILKKILETPLYSGTKFWKCYKLVLVLKCNPLLVLYKFSSPKEYYKILLVYNII